MTLDAHEFEQEGGKLSGEEIHESMSDADLENLLAGGKEEQGGEDDEKQEDADNSDEDAEEQKGDKADEEQPPTVESLQEKLAARDRELEQAKRERDHRQNVINRHSDELGKLRQMRANIENRIAARQQVDPTQQMIEDPNGYHQRSIDEANDQRDLQELEHYEGRVQMQATFEHNRHQVHSQVSRMGLTPEEFETTENMDAICQAMIEGGENPQHVEQFRQAPYMANPAAIMTYYQATQLRSKDAEIAELKQKLEAASKQPANMLQRIEQEARRKPLPNNGGKGGGKGSAVDLSQVESLSDAELEEAIKNAK